MKTRKAAIAIILVALTVILIAAYIHVDLTLRKARKELAQWSLETSHLDNAELAGSFKYFRLLGRRDAICEMSAELAANQTRRRLDSRDRGGWMEDPAAAALIKEAARECGRSSSELSLCRNHIISAHLKLWAEDPDGAREILDAVDAGDPQCVALREYALSQLQFQRRDPQSRLGHLQKALDQYRLLYPDGHWKSARALYDYGGALMDVKHYEQAHKALEESLRMMRESGASDIALSSILQKFGSCLLALRRNDEALEQFEIILKVKQAAYGDGNSEVGRAYQNLGNVFLEMGQAEKAAEPFAKALKIYRRELPEDHRDLEDALLMAGLAFDTAGDYERAKGYYLEALSVVRKKLPREHPRLAEVIQDLAAVELKAGRYDEAIRLHREAHAIYRKTTEIGSRILGSVLMDYAKLYKASGYAIEAALFALEAIEAWSQILPPDHVDILEARKFLAEAPDISDTPKLPYQSEIGGEGPLFPVPESESEPPKGEGKLLDTTQWDPRSGKVPSSIFYRYSSFNLGNIEKVKSLIRERIKGSRDLPSLFKGDSVNLDIRKYLKLSQSDVIADIGCGTGGFEVMLLVKSIEFKKLYAVDIDRYSLDILKFILDESQLPGREKIQIVQNTLDHIGLPEKSTDVMLLLNTPLYVSEDSHHKIKPDTLSTLKSMFFAIKPGGRLYVFDRVEVFGGMSDPFDSIIRPFESVGFKAVHREQMRIDNPHYHVVFAK